MSHVADLDMSRVYLLRDQTHEGRCVVALKVHRAELFHLDERMLQAFTREVTSVAGALASITACKKMNYGIFGDRAEHLHVHLVPKHPDRPNWGEAFPLANTEPALAPEDTLTAMGERIRQGLSVGWSTDRRRS